MRHDPLLTCAVAKARSEYAAQLEAVADKVPPMATAVIAHVAVVNKPSVVNRKLDRHKDKEARKVYHREVMRKRRAEGRA